MINISRTFERSSTCKLSKTSVSQVVHFVDLLYVTVPDKRDHFRQYFKIELLILKGRVALKQ